MSDTPSADRVALSREFSEFLVEFSVALHKFGMYPSGHPSLDPAAAAVVARANVLLVDRAQVAFGIARRQLIIEGAATNPNQPVLRRLAESLHGHHLGAVSLNRGLSGSEVAEALALLAREPEQHGAIGLAPPDQRPAWPHVRLHPLSFEGLALADDATTAGDGSGGGLRGAELWVGLARAAMAGDQRFGPVSDANNPDAEPSSTEPLLIARAIDEHPREAAYDQVIIGYLLQIARELRSGSGIEGSALRRRTARMVSALRPETLRRLVDMGGNAAQRREFVLDATHGMAVEAVIDIVKAAAEASGQTISHGLSRMLSKLAAHAEFGDATARPVADVALREQVGRLLTGWELSDPNPTAYSAVLQHLATSNDRAPAAMVVSPPAAVSALRLVEISLEIGETGPLVERAIDALIAEGQTADLVTLLSAAPVHEGDGLARMRARAGHPDAIRAVLQSTPPDFDSLDRLLPWAAADGYEVLLEALATADDRATRRRLLDRLAAAPVDLGERIVARLGDERWFVQRNMLVLLGRMGRLPPGVSLRDLAQHPTVDIRVRHEAIRLQLTVPDERAEAVRAALEDGHPRLVHSGLAAIQHDCPGSVALLVGSLATNPDLGEDMRVMAARALGRCRDRWGLQPLLTLVDGGRTLLGRPRLAERSPLVIAAVEALAVGWRADTRAATWLALAAESPDPDVRRAAESRPSPSPTNGPPTERTRQR